jgi:uncharacterized protein YhaN
MGRHLDGFKQDKDIVKEIKKYLPEQADIQDGVLANVEQMQVANFKPENLDEQNGLHRVLMGCLPTDYVWTVEERKAWPEAYEAHKNAEQKKNEEKVNENGMEKAKEKDQKPSLPRHLSPSVRIIASLIVSFLAGACIIAPMLFMSIRPDRSKNLWTASVAVVLFGFFMAAAVRMMSREVFLATATYAAVLAVFVAASNEKSGNSAGSGAGNGTMSTSNLTLST